MSDLEQSATEERTIRSGSNDESSDEDYDEDNNIDDNEDDDDEFEEDSDNNDNGDDNGDDDEDDDNESESGNDSSNNNDNNDDNVNDQVETRPTTSDVWNIVDKQKRECPSCGKIFGSKTGTSSIRSHLQNHGLLLVKEQTNLDNNSKNKYSRSEKMQAVIEWIVLDIQPFKVVEGDSFRKMVSRFDPVYQIPTRNTIKKFIKKSFDRRRNKIKEYISKNIPGKVSITTDIWSSIKNEGFLGITIHFIDKNWVLKHFTLDLFRFKGSHTGQSIANEIYKIIEEFGLQNRVISMTTDNASNMTACAKALENKFDHTFIHYRCVAHILNLIVTAGLNVINTPIKKLRKLIKAI
jgi:Protein of unknown function (DUF 659)